MYIGVKYIGKSESKEDTVCNTGAVWANGEVLNFEEESAKKLAVHTDSFELVDMSPSSKTYSNKQINTTDNYEPFPSLAGMDKEQIAKLASVRYGIKIEVEGREKDDVVFDALNRIKAANLRADATALGTSILPVVSLTVTDEEYKAYIAGKLELKLLPVGEKAPQMLSEADQAEAVNELKDAAPDLSIGELTLESGSLANVQNGPQSTEANNGGSSKPSKTEETPLGPEGAKEDNKPTLSELLATLNTKADLHALAKENNVKYANSMSVEQLKAKLLKELG